ncbi:hypothetical protein KORDIASMS9_03764 [Kordia sp. SMS9]|nr:hypothetical protein KORDIASMS9_03764 [Kordia sp. SMS9]
MNMKEKKYPVSHHLAVQNESYLKRGKLVQRCMVTINDNKRLMVSDIHWKPITKMIQY